MSMLINPEPEEGWDAAQGKFSVDPDNPSIILEFVPDTPVEGGAPEGEIQQGRLGVYVNNVDPAEAIAALETVVADLRSRVSAADVEAAQKRVSGEGEGEGDGDND